MDSAKEQLSAMGFSVADIDKALSRTSDVNEAAGMITSGAINKAVDEFDLLPDGPAGDAAPTAFNNVDHTKTTGQDPFLADTTTGAISEAIDSRISTFTSMGFSAEQAENALKQCGGDVNVALSLLTGEKS